MSIADSQYGYVPHEYVAVLFIALFGLSTSAFILTPIYYHLTFVSSAYWANHVSPHVVAIAHRLSLRRWRVNRLECASLVVFLAESPQSLHDSAGIVCTVVSPTPVNFVLLSWIISQLGPCYDRLSPRTYTILFIFSDVLGFLIQAAGATTRSAGLAGRAAAANDLRREGREGTGIMAGLPTKAARVGKAASDAAELGGGGDGSMGGCYK
ncbi:hypothetical protein C8R45DRAFT_1094799 [Mycena sanguinolenta]|nr:hypothetical protein C8R45DRAFT_1094799 [Mycena sanguinolenta]